MEGLPRPTPRFPVLDTLRILVGDQVDEDLLGGQLSSQWVIGPVFSSMLISSRQVQKLLSDLPRIQDKELVDIRESGAYFKSSSIN